MRRAGCRASALPIPLSGVRALLPPLPPPSAPTLHEPAGLQLAVPVLVCWVDSLPSSCWALLCYGGAFCNSHPCVPRASLFRQASHVLYIVYTTHAGNTSASGECHSWPCHHRADPSLPSAALFILRFCINAILSSGHFQLAPCNHHLQRSSRSTAAVATSTILSRIPTFEVLVFYGDVSVGVGENETKVTPRQTARHSDPRTRERFSCRLCMQAKESTSYRCLTRCTNCHCCAFWKSFGSLESMSWSNLLTGLATMARLCVSPCRWFLWGLVSIGTPWGIGFTRTEGL